jgi:hypothetical protein
MFLMAPKAPEIQNGYKQVQSTIHLSTSMWICKLRIIQFLESSGFVMTKILQTNVSELLNKLFFLEYRKYLRFCLFKKDRQNCKFFTLINSCK